MDHVAIDLGGRESQICVRNAAGEITDQRRVATKKLKAFFKKLDKSRVILETCAEAFAIAAQAKEAGHEVRVVPATLVRALGVGQRGIKTDQRDAQCLSQVSTRVEIGSVHIPTAASQQLKTQCGMREALVSARTMLINNVRGWLRCNLIRIRGGISRTFPRRVREYFGDTDTKLPTYVDRQLTAIDALSEQIAAADVELAQAAAESPECKRLMTIPGVGALTSLRVFAAIDQVDRFPNAHRLESYFGLTPGESSSSDSKHRTSLTKAGGAKVRRLVVQSAWCAMRTRPQDPMVLWAHRIASKTKPQVAAVALSRKLVGIMFALLRDRSTYDPKRGSSVQAVETSQETKIVATSAEVIRMARKRAISET